jgi:hypothetical protein
MATNILAQCMTIDEVIARYTNEWIFMKVIGEDEHGEPAWGVVLAHHPKRGVLQRVILKQIAARRNDAEQYYIFQAYPRTSVPIARTQDADERQLDTVERIMIRELSV